MKGEEVEIFVKHKGKTLKVVLKDEAVQDIEDIREQIGSKSIIEAIVYSIKILTEGLKELDDGAASHEVELPNGTKLSVKITKETE